MTASCSTRPSIPTSARSNPTSRRSRSTSASRCSFPEKRPFFLENSNYFTSPINLVFTRRIGHPEFGLRLTGKSGPWAVGVLASDDRAPGEILPPTDPHAGDRATFTIARVSRDILDQSTIGAIYTDREFGGGYNRVGGIDANLKLNPNWRVQGQAVTSSTLDVIAGTQFRRARLQNRSRALRTQVQPAIPLRRLQPRVRHRNRLRESRRHSRADAECQLLFPSRRKIPDLVRPDATAIQHLGPQRDRSRLLCLCPVSAWT